MSGILQALSGVRRKRPIDPGFTRPSAAAGQQTIQDMLEKIRGRSRTAPRGSGLRKPVR